jgi:putative flippase GtrA
MSGNMVLFVGGLGVAVNVAVLWLSLRMARRASCEFDNTR